MAGAETIRLTAEIVMLVKGIERVCEGMAVGGSEMNSVCDVMAVRVWGTRGFVLKWLYYVLKLMWYLKELILMLLK